MYEKEIEKRKSCRSYSDNFLLDEQIKKLRELILRINKESGLNISLVVNNKEAFKDFKKSYGMFKNVNNYFVLIGKKNDVNLKEKCGYYGELLVLEATRMGLGTCFVGSTYNSSKIAIQVVEDEELIALITVGYPQEKETFFAKILTSSLHKKFKNINQLMDTDEEVPFWFTKGVQFALLAPSALNKHPIVFTYKMGEVRAKITDNSDYALIDLGIAKLHFELGALNGKFILGDNGIYTIVDYLNL